jgi:nitrous oxidase accessory protein NosD
MTGLGIAMDHTFTTPEAPLVASPDEEIRTLILPAGTADSAQSRIDACRKENPDAVILLETSGPLEVGSTPLKLGSRMMLRLSPAGGISAAANSTADSLIKVTDAQWVSISSSGPGPAVLDGGGKALSGIRVIGGGRINFDQLVLSNCEDAGIDYQGRDTAAVNEASSVTRCDFMSNGDGLRVDQTAGFMCLDNTFTGQSGTALSIRSLMSVVAGNTFSGNQAAIRSSSDRGVVTRNVIGDVLALELTPDSTGNLVSENRGTKSDLQLTLGGSRNQLFRNDFNGSASATEQAKDILLLGNLGIQTDPSATALKVFNPPTFGQPHNNPVIVPGMGRFDLSVPGGKSAKKDIPVVPVDLKVVVDALQRARAEHPDDVIVLKLDGEYISRSGNGLELPPNTCVILEGRILADLRAPLDPLWVRGETLSQLILLPKTGYCSVSGGKLDCGRQAFFPINANTLTSGARDGVNTKGRDPKSPVFVYRCNVLANNGRGIWAHVATRVHAISNTCSGNRQDGIDLDAGSVAGTALFNVSSGNGRHGVFVEEAISHNMVFGNILNGNGQAGVHVWNEEVEENTGSNIIAANQCDANRRGISAGGRAPDKTAHGNFFFNNVCRYNRLNGIMAGNSNAKGNYFSQSVVGQNREQDVLTTPDGFFFNQPTVSPGKISPPQPDPAVKSGIMETKVSLWWCAVPSAILLIILLYGLRKH